MNDNRMKRWMDAIDDDLLEEAQRPLPRGGAARRWGALAACFCAAALALALWQPWSAGIGDNTAGADADFGAMDKSFSVAMPPVSDAELLSASLALPEGASLTSDYRWRQDGEGAVTGVSCTVLLDGYDYDYSAAYASQPLPAPDGTLPTDTYQVNGLTLLVYDDGAVGWYDTSAGIQWYCVAWDGGAPLVTAFTLMDAQYYTVPTAPEGADVLGYDLFDLDGSTVTEVSFTLDGVTWHYRMAPTLDVSETIPDISDFTGGSLTAEGRLRWCPTVLRWDAGGAGCIIWRDIAPGLAYSLTADTGASEKTLADMAALVSSLPRRSHKAKQKRKHPAGCFLFCSEFRCVRCLAVQQGLALGVHQYRQPAGIARRVIEILHAGLGVHPDLISGENALSVHLFKAFRLCHSFTPRRARRSPPAFSRWRPDRPAPGSRWG